MGDHREQVWRWWWVPAGGGTMDPAQTVQVSQARQFSGVPLPGSSAPAAVMSAERGGTWLPGSFPGRMHGVTGGVDPAHIGHGDTVSEFSGGPRGADVRLAPSHAGVPVQGVLPPGTVRAGSGQDSERASVELSPSLAPSPPPRSPHRASARSSPRRREERNKGQKPRAVRVGIKCVNCAPGCPNLGSRRHHHVSGMCGRCHQRWIKRANDRWTMHHCFSKCRCQRCGVSRGRNLLVGVAASRKVPVRAVARTPTPTTLAGDGGAEAPSAAAGAGPDSLDLSADADPSSGFLWANHAQSMLLRSFDGLRGGTNVVPEDHERQDGTLPLLDSFATAFFAVAGDEMLRSEVPVQECASPQDCGSERQHQPQHGTGVSPETALASRHRRGRNQSNHHETEVSRRGANVGDDSSASEWATSSRTACEADGSWPRRLEALSSAESPCEITLCIMPPTTVAHPEANAGVFPMHVSSMNPKATAFFRCPPLHLREQCILLPLVRIFPFLEDLAKIWAMFLRLQLTCRPQKALLVVTSSADVKRVTLESYMAFIPAEEASVQEERLPGCTFATLTTWEPSSSTEEGSASNAHGHAAGPMSR
uniref:Uncharacterized protein n=2 Tax=Rhizochromulina marina TaxID=1034831 RepID=A0A7S2R6X0_9STRA|mmetsp:Transcript_1196/g.3757  ORF Transcript_1196/g.3757 Transcript_1196/m.3757 type:complete len:593 (+) Transcript_1196:312-2090(+)